ncbi:MAG: class I SAM-dependent methyltransferase [Actinomycetota bacterium]
MTDSQRPDTVDEYASSAEFHEIHMDAAWAELADVVGVAFSGLTSRDVVVDLGAGSGAGTVVLASQTPAEILAVEPSASMRSMLLVRLAQAGLTDRVTVVAEGVPDAYDVIDEPITGLVGGHMLGHLGAEDRRELFSWLGQRLAVTGTAVFTVSGSAPPDPSAVFVEERRVGRHVYRASHSSPDRFTYASTFEVVDGDRVLRSVDVTGRWERVTFRDLESEIDGAGLVITEARPGVVMVRRSPEGRST